MKTYFPFIFSFDFRPTIFLAAIKSNSFASFIKYKVFNNKESLITICRIFHRVQILLIRRSPIFFLGLKVSLSPLSLILRYQLLNKLFLNQFPALYRISFHSRFERWWFVNSWILFDAIWRLSAVKAAESFAGNLELKAAVLTGDRLIRELKLIVLCRWCQAGIFFFVVSVIFLKNAVGALIDLGLLMSL